MPNPDSNQQTFAAVDDFIADRLLPPDPVLDHILQATADAGLPDIQVAPTHGKLLTLLATLVSAQRILEVGTLGGYSTTCLARALPPTGRLISLEFDPHHADVARANLQHAGVAERCDIRVGKALDLLPNIVTEAQATILFDLVFIDADKENNPAYVRHAADCTRPGGLILVDNAVRGGRIADPNERDADDPSLAGTRAVYDTVAQHPRLAATALQTVGHKGYDGLLLAVVQPD